MIARKGSKARRVKTMVKIMELIYVVLLIVTVSSAYNDASVQEVIANSALFISHTMLMIDMESEDDD
jgi:uncharacterized membrane protein YjgN (DUF898 family)